MKKNVYLDHAAATPLSASVVKVMRQHEAVYGNASSMHWVGRQAHDAAQAARAMLANSLQVDAEELVVTGSGTESANLAIIGLARAYRSYGTHIIISAIEHKAVLAAADTLSREGFTVTRLPVDRFGCVSAAAVRQALTPNTILVSIMYANNEIGTIEPLTELLEVVHTYRGLSTVPLFHTDACQAAGLIPLLPRALGVDAMTINSAKIYGPKGIGLLYVRSTVKVEPLIVGGDQERGLRAGTENIALLAGFATALADAVKGQVALQQKLTVLSTLFRAALSAAVPGIIFNGHPTARLSHNVHVTIPDVEGESIILMLSEFGVCAATGSACASFDLAPSHVLAAIGQDDNLIHGSVRFTLGRDTTEEELYYTATTLGKIVSQLRTITASTTAAYIQSHT